MASGKKLVVGAIDFGTTYSGWAFSFLHDFQSDPPKISTNHWYSGGQFVSEKTPTCVLIQPDGRTLEAFGFEAENRYIELAETGDHEQYYYFKKFKMALHKKFDEICDRYIVIEDSAGRSLPAMEVFALSIEYLVNSMMKVGGDRTMGLTKDDVRWVLTVPAIWSDSAKQFMREAAVQAGIDNENLVIALEPEAASIFCRHVPVWRSSTKQGPAMTSFKHDSMYMVMDAGGGTVDITVHKLNASGGLEEVFSASGGGWGGTLVDTAFESLLVDITDKAVYQEFIRREPDDWIDLWREFEIKKKSVCPDIHKPVTIKIPASLPKLLQDMKGKAIEDQIKDSKFSGQIKFKSDKLTIDAIVLQDCFKEATKKTVEHLKAMFEEKDMVGTNTILMVGGFSDSPMLQHAIKSAFPNIGVICPSDSVTAVMKGAVLFGHNPGAIAARVLKYTYGYEAAVPFVPGIHPESLKIENEHGVQCAHGFIVYAKGQQTIRCDETPVSATITPQFSYQSWINIPIYATICKPPEYIDHSLTRIGEITVELEEHDGDIDREIDLTIHFDGTEIEIRGTDVKTGTIVKSRIDFLG